MDLTSSDARRKGRRLPEMATPNIEMKFDPELVAAIHERDQRLFNKGFLVGLFIGVAITCIAWCLLGAA